MLKRRSGKKYVRNGLLCIPEGYLAEKMAYIGEICARSGWIIIATVYCVYQRVIYIIFATCYSPIRASRSRDAALPRAFGPRLRRAGKGPASRARVS